MNDVKPRTPFFERDTQRLLTLTDGVFSIVLTLMVFNIALPKDSSIEGLERALMRLWPSFVSFGISIGLVGIYWSAHHSMFRFIEKTTHELVWLNMLFLASVALIPFSTTLLAAHHDNPVALAVYGASLILVGLTLLPLRNHATRHHRLVPPDLPDNVIRYGRSRILVGIFGYSLATGFAFVEPRFALVGFAALPWLYILSPVQRAWLRLYDL